MIEVTIGAVHDLTTCQPYLRPVQDALRWWRFVAECEAFVLFALVLAAVLYLRRR